MSKKRVFVSFDYDNDQGLKNLLVGQSKHPDTPFDLADWSIKEPLSGDWEKKARSKIKGVDIVVVICGEHTDKATGVDAELRIAKDENIDYFLLWGHPEKNCVKPRSANKNDIIYKWTWEYLKILIGGGR